MRQLLILTAITILICSCADNKTIDGVEYKTYGLIDKEEVKDPCIKYSLSVGNIIWAGILIEAVIPTGYFLGWSLWEPENKIEGCNVNGGS